MLSLFKPVSKTLPDVNCAYEVATVTKKKRIEYEIEVVLKPQIVLATEIAMRNGHFETWLLRHNTNLLSDSVNGAIGWLKDSGYTSYLRSNPRDCHCSAHIAWNWQNKRIRIEGKKDVIEAPVEEVLRLAMKEISYV